MALKDSDKLRSSDDKKFKGHTEYTKVAAKPGDKLNLFKKFQQASGPKTLAIKLLLGNMKYLLKQSLKKNKK